MNCKNILLTPFLLIIEDDPAIREALADLLDSLGHDHHAVGSQNEARERLSRCAYDYVLLDLELPIRFGRPPSIPVGKNLLLEIRGDPRHSGTPVLVVTAHGGRSEGPGGVFSRGVSDRKCRGTDDGGVLREGGDLVTDDIPRIHHNFRNGIVESMTKMLVRLAEIS